MVARLSIRSFRVGDLPAIVDLVRTAAAADGEPWPPSPAELDRELAPSPSFDPERDCVVALAEDGQLAGYAYVALDHRGTTFGRGVGCVATDRRRQGIGTLLWRAADERFIERAKHAAFIERCLLDSLPGARVLAAREGYLEQRTSDFIETALAGIRLHAPLPDGFSLTPFEPSRDARAVFAVDRSLFAGAAGYDAWVSRYIHQPYFDPALWLVGSDRDAIAGYCIAQPYSVDHPDSAWILRLGVLPRSRRRGLGMALLCVCFDRLRTRGFHRAALATPGGPTIRSFYTRAGMRVSAHYTYHRKALVAQRCPC